MGCSPPDLFLDRFTVMNILQRSVPLENVAVSIEPRRRSCAKPSITAVPEPDAVFDVILLPCSFGPRPSSDRGPIILLVEGHSRQCTKTLVGSYPGQRQPSCVTVHYLSRGASSPWNQRTQFDRRTIQIFTFAERGVGVSLLMNMLDSTVPEYDVAVLIQPGQPACSKPLIIATAKA